MGVQVNGFVLYICTVGFVSMKRNKIISESNLALKFMFHFFLFSPLASFRENPILYM